MNADQCRDMLNLSFVKRWVIAPTRREQSVAEHSFRVAAITDYLINTGVGVRERLTERWMQYALWKALIHDLDEVYTGDIPGPAKDRKEAWRDPGTMFDADIVVKVADSIETYTWWQQFGERWNHPMAPGAGDANRDIRKILHYTEKWPELYFAAYRCMTEVFQLPLNVEGAPQPPLASASSGDKLDASQREG